MSETKMTFGEWCLALPIVILVVGGIFLLMVPTALLITYIRVELWSWFVVTYLHLPMVPFWAMYGLMLFTGTFSVVKVKSSDFEPSAMDHWNTMWISVVGWLMAWGLGYVVHVWLLR